MAGKMFIGNKAVTPVIIKGGSPEPESVVGKIVFNNERGGFELKDVTLGGIKELNEFKGNILSRIDYTDAEYNYHPLNPIYEDVVINELEYARNSALQQFLYGQEYVENVTFEKLVEISGYRTFYVAFSGCTALKSVVFLKLENILSTDEIFRYAFQNTNGVNVYFNSIKNIDDSAFSRMLNFSKNITIHFPSNMEQRVFQLSGYPTFGGSTSEVTLSFDLLPTE